MKKTIFSAAVVISGVLYTASLVQAYEGVKLFRYRNGDGKVVMTYVLPPEQMEKGYEVLTPRGDVIEVVPPAPSLEERIRMREEARSAEDQAKYDRDLLLMFGTLADLKAVRDRRIGELEGKLKVLRGNQNNIKLSIENEQFKAAGYERRGEPVPDLVLDVLSDLYGNLEKTNDLIAKRETEVEEETLKFEEYQKRYKELKGLK